MAGPSIQRRWAKPHVWMLGALFLLVVWGVAWGVFEVWQGQLLRSPPETTRAAAVAPATVPPALDRFMRFAQTEPHAGQAQQYTRTGIYLLAGALRQELARRPVPDAALTQRQHALQVLADRMDALPQVPASLVRAAAVTGSDLLAALQAAGSPISPRQVNAVRAAALALQPQTPLHPQGAALQTFFQRSADALASMTKA